MCQAVPNKKRRPRKRILAAAKDAFEVQGFEGTNLRSITQASGMATGTIFVHFRDKRVQLHAALFEDLAQTLHDVLDTPRDPSLEQWLERLTDQLLTY